MNIHHTLLQHVRCLGYRKYKRNHDKFNVTKMYILSYFTLLFMINEMHFHVCVLYLFNIISKLHGRT
ncbi:hypothetical protein C2G38_2087431 [Gigaspora rosea]|uniref:Uncharacterized protein n=1 Tax=Gigaspora rosea TaxID=44941 RepID=A0A397VEM9_9GLOM|nr:hypothetical protein C2G38_2087431 [Gigaspora rosea]